MASSPAASSPPAPAPSAAPAASRAARATVWAPLGLLAFVVLLGLVVRGHNGVTEADSDVLTELARGRPGWLVELAKVVTTFGRFDTLLVIAVGAAFALVAWTTDPRQRNGAPAQPRPDGDATAPGDEPPATGPTAPGGDDLPSTTPAAPAPSPWLPALTPLLALVLSEALNALTKAIVERPRPAEALRAVVEHGTGYSSGHSAHAAAVWIALALVLPAAHRRWWRVAGATIAACVGASRVIFAVHSPTDVLGGWALGLACALLAWQITQRGAGVTRATDRS